jgi:chemotaxis protein CheD
VVTVGIADCRLGREPGQVLVTYALGSCVAVAIHDPVAQVGGLLHFMLPDSGIDPEKARQNPYMFADTGVPLLFRRSYELGADKRRLIVHIAGGAQVMDSAGVFNIGKRNYLALRKILWKAGVLIRSEAVGGSVSRTVRLEVDTGKVWLRSEGVQEMELAESPAPPNGGPSWHCVS